MIHMKRSLLLLCGILVFKSVCPAPASPVGLESLLDEMVNRESLARFPDPTYRCFQASSYDRGSTAPNQPGWYANSDHSHYLRSEENEGREEWVMMDVKGAGAVVRIWVTSGTYKGTVRFYLDGSDQPVLEARVDELIGGEALVGPPLSAPRARGRNLYLPLPFARACKITFDRPNFYETNAGEDQLYYQINYRSYDEGTEVKSFAREDLEQLRTKLRQVQQALLQPDSTQPMHADSRAPVAKLLLPGESLQVDDKGPGALSRLQIKLKAEDLTQALRSTVLKATFDGEQTLWCPLGDFFGSGVGLNPYTSWYRQVQEDGTLVCQWVMPWRQASRIEVENLGEQRVHVTMVTKTIPWQWDENSLHFHANWRQEGGIETANGGARAFDWNYLVAGGRGVYVGDTLSVRNQHAAWWGEGDEKIYVDGEAFPSHIGTGTEDYYGYAWCTPEFFEAPFHAQPRVEGPSNFGHTTNTRTRSLDAIPFNRSYRMDMEVWHWATTTVDYAVATYWYGRPGSTATFGADLAGARLPVQRDTQLEDCAGFKLGKYSGGIVQPQQMGGIGNDHWTHTDQLWWIDGKPGDTLEIKLTGEIAGEREVAVIMTKAVDYGIVQFHLNGRKLGNPVDLFHTSVVRTEPILLGKGRMKDGENILTVEIAGANPEAVKRHMVGIDEILIH